MTRYLALPLLMAAGMLFTSCEKQIAPEKNTELPDGSMSRFVPNSCPPHACIAREMHKYTDDFVKHVFQTGIRDDVPAYLQVYLGLDHSQEVTMDVNYSGNVVVLSDRLTQDTILLAKLDHCGRVTESTYSDPLTPKPPVKWYYEYHNGRLHAIMYSPVQKPAYTFTYDEDGNLLTLASTKGLGRLDYSYDTTQPVTGNSMYFEGRSNDFAQLTMLEILGHVNLQPKAIRISARASFGSTVLNNYQYGKHIIVNGDLINFVEIINGEDWNVSEYFHCPSTATQTATSQP